MTYPGTLAGYLVRKKFYLRAAAIRDEASRGPRYAHTSETLAADVRRFLAAGGRIKQLPATEAPVHGRARGFERDW
jgi:hypothetical protein